MSTKLIRVGSSIGLAVGLGVATLLAQGALTAEAHRAAARTAAGKDHSGLLAALCPDPAARGAAAARGGAATPQAGQAPGAAAAGRRGQAPRATPAPRTTPPRDQWHAEPVKVFDNLSTRSSTTQSRTKWSAA